MYSREALRTPLTPIFSPLGRRSSTAFLPGRKWLFNVFMASHCLETVVRLRPCRSNLSAVLARHDPRVFSFADYRVYFSTCRPLHISHNWMPRAIPSFDKIPKKKKKQRGKCIVFGKIKRHSALLCCCVILHRSAIKRITAPVRFSKEINSRYDLATSRTRGRSFLLHGRLKLGWTITCFTVVSCRSM